MVKANGTIDATGVDLKVAEALNKDVGRGFARLDPDVMSTLGIRTGDTVTVRGKRSTVCRAMPTFREQRGRGLVQVDGITRHNAGAAIDETVQVLAVNCPPADSVTIAPSGAAPSERDLQYIGSRMDGLPVTTGDTVRATLFGSRAADFVVEATRPGGPVLIHPGTRLIVGRKQGGKAAAGGDRSRISYEDIGGLKPQLHRIREMIELPLRFPEVFERLGIDAPKGVLLHGPPGCGKTLIARAIAQETEANFYTVSGPEIIHKFYGESEAHLRKIWEEATRKGPSIIFLDEVDSIAPRRDDTKGDVEKRVVAQLLALMDGLERSANVIVIAATNLPNAIDPALRRPGRFDREIAIPIPDRHGRRQILDVHSRGMPLADDVDLDHMADITHGFVGADLEALCRESAMSCLRTIMDDIDFSAASIPYEQLSTLEVTGDHFRSALNEVDASAVREVFVEVPDVSWEDIGGLHDIKAQLREAVEWPLKHPALFDRAHVRPPRGILLAGPPGVGKTMIAKAVANEASANFIPVKGPELMSRFVGESEKGMREIFRKARQAAPCILFFDEVDALLPRRGGNGDGSGVADRVLAQFLSELDGIEELRGVLVLGATNRLDMLDEAVTRPGRFDVIVELDRPDEEARVEILRVHLANRPVEAGVDPVQLAASSHGASGAELADACDRAALAAVRRAVEAVEAGREPAIEITAADLDEAVASINRRPGR
jgi:transitional endoplasmic reticulum ATPase